MSALPREISEWLDACPVPLSPLVRESIEETVQIEADELAEDYAADAAMDRAEYRADLAYAEREP